MRWTCLAVLAIGEILKQPAGGGGGGGGGGHSGKYVPGTCTAHTAKTHSAECAEAAHGGFDATDESLNTVQNCAQYAKEKCGDKAVYVSFHEGEAGFMGGKGECLWYTTCACSEHTPESNCDRPQGLTKQFETGKITDLLSSVTAGGDGSEAPASAADPLTDPNKIPGTVKDPTVTMNEAATLLRDAGTPEKAELMTIPDATEIDMKMLRENPKAMFSEAKKVGQVEPDCPDDYEAAKLRGEWQCLKRRKPINEVTTYILMSGVAMCCVCTCVFHMIGRRIRSAKEDLMGEQEEEEEEEFTEE